jgi:hypothetical protein
MAGFARWLRAQDMARAAAVAVPNLSRTDRAACSLNVCFTDGWDVSPGAASPLIELASTETNVSVRQELNHPPHERSVLPSGGWADPANPDAASPPTLTPHHWWALSHLIALCDQRFARLVSTAGPAL